MAIFFIGIQQRDDCKQNKNIASSTNKTGVILIKNFSFIENTQSNFLPQRNFFLTFFIISNSL